MSDPVVTQPPQPAGELTINAKVIGTNRAYGWVTVTSDHDGGPWVHFFIDNAPASLAVGQRVTVIVHPPAPEAPQPEPPKNIVRCRTCGGEGVGHVNHKPGCGPGYLLGAANRAAGGAVPVDRPPAAPTHNRAGVNSKRQSVGLPGHCERCADVGHVLAHPELGCGDVGCELPHADAAPVRPPTAE